MLGIIILGKIIFSSYSIKHHNFLQISNGILLGHLQSNKTKPLLAGLPNLYMVESVDSSKIANHLDSTIESLGREPLKFLMQVNTSDEESKYGVEPSKCVHLAKQVKQECQNVEFLGLVTIGMLDFSLCYYYGKIPKYL